MVRIKSDKRASKNSGKSSVGQKPAPEDTLTGVELVRSRRLSAEELKRLGLDTRDTLVISTQLLPRTRSEDEKTES